MKRLKLSPEVAYYLESRGIPLPKHPPKHKTPEPRKVRGAEFDPERVDKVLRSFRALRHTQGQWAGKPLTLDPWEIAYIVAPVFGWIRYDEDSARWVRIIRVLYVDVPRKNGKSTLCGGLAIYLTCADGEEGAQVLAAATTKDQAGFVFEPVKRLATKSPILARRVKAYKDKIVHTRSGSYFKPIANVADAQHGANIHGTIVDELHIHKSAELVKVLETGTGSRTQPLVVFITTADDGEQGTIYATKRDLVEKLARGTLTNPAVYGVIFAADEKDPPFAESTQRKANPGYGISPTRAYLRDAANTARQSPAELAAYLRLHLGIRTKQDTRYIELAPWDRNAGLVVESALAGRRVYGGLDLASTSDLCALCWTFPDDEGGFDVLWRHWVPERAFKLLDERTANNATLWRKAGLLKVTPGDVADYDYIEQQINRDREAFDVQAIGYDRWNASQLVNDLTAAEAPMVQIGQGFASQSAPLKAILHAILSGKARAPKYRHGGNSLVRWQVDNLAVARDAAGNVKPDKARSADKIDGISAANDAMAMVLAAEDTESVYESRGFRTL